MSTPQAQAASREVRALLARGQLGEARRRAALAVQATAARLPPCVHPGPAQGSTFTVLFWPGEALRLLTSVGGGRVTLYEVQPEGVRRVWQAQRSLPAASGPALARVLGVRPGAPQCGTPPALNGPLEAYSFSPFAGARFVDVVNPDGRTQRVRAVNLDRQEPDGRVTFCGLPDAPPQDPP
ncbi:hypothetical protein [Deinococcus sp. NW-56]|uniref:hypothetical protein n=1 Tax=Deinococcus sp. NW-56 TaxID=2080419 RepID=UPI000CF575D7|nr:hypothetical protein [Deinococcus sp. NW-56]